MHALSNFHLPYQSRTNKKVNSISQPPNPNSKHTPIGTHAALAKHEKKKQNKHNKPATRASCPPPPGAATSPHPTPLLKPCAAPLAPSRAAELPPPPPPPPRTHAHSPPAYTDTEETHSQASSRRGRSCPRSAQPGAARARALVYTNSLPVVLVVVLVVVAARAVSRLRRRPVDGYTPALSSLTLERERKRRATKNTQ